MGKFKELSSYLDEGGDVLELTVDGHEYRIEEPDAKTGLKLMAMMDAAQASDGVSISTVLKDATATGLYQELLGPALDEMQTRGMKASKLRTVFMTAVLYFAAGEEAATLFWEAGGRPEALSPEGNRAQRRRKTRSHRTGGDGRTR